MALLWTLTASLTWTLEQTNAGEWDPTFDPIPPVITSFSPQFGPVGERILILGDNLGETTEVTINGTPARFEVGGWIDPRKHMVNTWVPANATTGPIKLTTPHGSFTTAEPFVVTDGQPVIESFSPTSGPPGTFIVVHGQNLVYATSLRLNGLEMDQWYSMGNPSRTLHARVPATATTGPISVTTPYGTFTSAANFTVTASPPLTVQDWPTATEAGMRFFLLVNDNYLVREVQLNGTSIPFSLLAPPDVLVELPANAISGPLTIVTVNETVTSPQPLIVHPRPLLTGARPKSGPPGTVVQLVGRNLQNVIQVWLGSMTVPFDKETLTFTVPSDAKTGFLTIDTPFSAQITEVEFAITSGRVITSSGSIGGPVPQLDPRPVTGITPAVGERLTSDPAAHAVSTRPLTGVLSYGTAIPALAITSSSGNGLKLSWPADATEYIVEMSQELAPGDWRAIGQVPMVKNDVSELVIPMKAGQSFFRLTPLQAGQR